MCVLGIAYHFDKEKLLTPHLWCIDRVEFGNDEHMFFFLPFLSSESFLVDRRDECGRCESWQDHFNFLYNDTSITIISFNLMVVISPTIKQMTVSK